MVDVGSTMTTSDNDDDELTTTTTTIDHNNNNNIANCYLFQLILVVTLTIRARLFLLAHAHGAECRPNRRTHHVQVGWFGQRIGTR